MKLKRLELENFRRFKHAELDFEPGVFLVRGLNKDAGFDSNGAGKSSLFYGLSWVLFGKFLSPDGKVVRGSTVINKDIGNNCSGAVELERGGIDYRVERYLKHKRHKNACFVKPKGDAVGCSFESFCSLVLFHGGGDLFYGSRQRRRDFLCKLFAVDRFVQSLKDVSRKEKKFFAEELTELTLFEESNRTRVSSLKESLEQQTKLVSMLKRQIEDKKNKILEVVDAIKQIKAEKQELAARQQENFSIQFDKEIDKIKEQIASVSLGSDKIDRVNKKLGASQFEVARLKRLIDQLTQLSDEPECPTCFNKIDPARLSRVIDKSKEELLSCETQVRELSLELETLVAARKEAEKKREQLREQLESLRRRKAEMEGKLATRLAQLDSDLNRNLQLATTLKSELEQVTGELKSFGFDQMEKIRSEISQKSRVLKHLPDTIKCVSDLAGGYNWWFNSVGSEFVTFALGSFNREIEIMSRKFLSRVWGPEIEVKLHQDGVELFVDGREFKLQDLSTGEQKRVFLSVALASNLVARRFSGWTCNLVVFDEIFDGLDSTGRLDLIRMASDLVEWGYSIFIVTHHIDLDVNQFDGVYQVVRSKGFSELERVA